MKKKLSLDEARKAAVAYMRRHGMPEGRAGMVADHLIYATMAGHDFAGFSRLPPLARMLEQRGPGGKIETVRETPTSAFIEGANVNGYVTSVMGMDKAIALAKKSGAGMVSVRNSWFSGMLRYYVERAASAGLVGFHAANAGARVAPYGGIDRLLGTNPIAFAFPTQDDPLVIDFSSASLMWGDVLYHQQIGKPLPEGRAVDEQGKPTTDPASALAGAIMAWGGVRGSALAIAIQALGILGGSDPIVGEDGVWGYFFLAIDPGVLLPPGEYPKKVTEMRDAILASRPAVASQPVRMPGSSATRNVAQGRERGWIEVDEAIYKIVAG